ncbi:MAG: putative porin [Bacteroidota bacterium]
MGKFVAILFLTCLANPAFSQVEALSIKADSLPPAQELDSTKVFGDKVKKGQPSKTISIQDYKIISHSRDTTFIDTTLTIHKEYKYNYLRRDDFELMPFSNMGQPYNSLGKEWKSAGFYPRIGAKAKHFGYKETEDIQYYHVPTPMTELMFKTTLEQGQFLDALLTLNTSERFNISIAHIGFRSLGKYDFDQAESANFRTTFNYTTKNGRYHARGHFVSHNIETEENGGILNREQFESGEEEFIDRARVNVVFDSSNETDNRVLGKRYFLDHRYTFFKTPQDSTTRRRTAVALGHQFNYETRYYQFRQENQAAFFGEDPFIDPIDDKANLKTMFNEVSLQFSNSTLGSLTGSLAHYNYQYFFNSLLIDGVEEIQNKLEGDEVTLGGQYANNIGAIDIRGDVRYTVSGDLTDNLIDVSVDYKLSDANSISAGVSFASRMPNFNFLLYQSDYRNFNWQNTETFEKQNFKGITLGLRSNFMGSISAGYTAIDNYTYFQSIATAEQIGNRQENAFVRPFQEESTINHLKIKYTKELKWKNWALNNTLMYQDVSQDNTVLNMPQFVTRNTLYFAKDIFKKAMFLQTGITFKYFTAYNVDAYSPLLGEFYIQNREEFGGFPMFDFFINAKVRQTRIFLKAEHFNSSFTGYDFYAAPNYPYRDFVIRFGLVWNFFS